MDNSEERVAERVMDVRRAVEDAWRDGEQRSIDPGLASRGLLRLSCGCGMYFICSQCCDEGECIMPLEHMLSWDADIGETCDLHMREFLAYQAHYAAWARRHGPFAYRLQGCPCGYPTIGAGKMYESNAVLVAEQVVYSMKSLFAEFGQYMEEP